MEQFLLFSTVFSTRVTISINHFVWKSLKFVVWERVNEYLQVTLIYWEDELVAIKQGKVQEQNQTEPLIHQHNADDSRFTV